MADLWCSLAEALRVDLVKFLSEIFSASFSPSEAYLRLLLLIKMADSHRNCQHQ